MAHAEEGVCKRHTRHSSRVSNLFAGERLILTVLVAGGQILKDNLERLERQTVGEVGRHHRGVSLQRVGNRVDTRSGGESLGAAHHKVGVNDSHIGHKLIVRERIFDTCFLIGDDREGSNLRACSR